MDPTGDPVHRLNTTNLHLEAVFQRLSAARQRAKGAHRGAGDRGGGAGRWDGRRRYSNSRRFDAAQFRQRQRGGAVVFRYSRDMLVFLILVVAAFAWRWQPEAQKRLIGVSAS